MTAERERERRRAIVDAARWCFLHFGYGRTTLDDIAKRAALSRPLIYRAFENKEQIYRAVLEDGFEERYPRAVAALAETRDRAAQLERLAEILLLEPWAEVAAAPMAAEFYEACERLMPDVEQKQRRRVLKLIQEVLPERELAEVFWLAVDGLYGDLPTAVVLRKRLAVLIRRFV